MNERIEDAIELKPKHYHLVMKFNDKVFESDTDDLEASILAVKPPVLKTKMLFIITDNTTGKVCERQVFVFRGKQIFKNKLSMRIFLSFLIFK